MHSRSQPLLLAFVWLLGSGAPSKGADPASPYPGYAADAPWRRVAAERIEKIRKGDLRVRVIDAAGRPVPGVSVTINQVRHAFGFGSAVQAWRVRDGDPRHAQYQKKVAELFNLATLENSLKQAPWNEQWGDKYSRAGALAALDWLRGQGIANRGHVMVWPGLKKLPDGPEKRLVERGGLSSAQQERVREWLAGHIRNVGTATAGRLVAWDVINEPRTNHDVMGSLPEGDAIMAAWFRLARGVAPRAKLYLNEFNLLASGGATDTENQRLLESQVRRLQAAGAPIDGVGLQSHFREHLLTGPEQLWAIVDRYTALDLDVQATEFDFETTDEQLQADYLRDFYTALFAHEGVSAIVMWGFWEEAHWRPDAAIYRKDWSPKPAARVYRDLVRKQWRTREQVTVDAGGESTVRAFRGEHLVRTAYGNHTATASVIVDADGGDATLQLAVLPGDYNGDGKVDAGDYTLWRDTFGQEVAVPGSGADGDADGRITEADKAFWQAKLGEQPKE